MELFLQHPFYLGLGGFVSLVLVFYFWTQTRFSWLLYLMGVVALAVIGLIVLERMIVTDEEAIKQTLSRLAAAVERNDIEASLDFFSEDMTEVRARARSEMPNYEFKSCRITKYKEFGDTVSNRNALVVTFNVFVDVSAPHFANFKGKAPREVTLTLEKRKSGEWKIIEYSHRAPIRFRP